MVDLTQPSFVFFVQEAQGANLLCSFTHLYDRISFDAHRVKRELLPECKLIDDVLRAEINPIQMRRLVVVEKKPYAQLGMTRDELVELYNSIDDDETKRFIEYLFVAPFDYYKSKLNELRAIGTFGDEALEQFIRENPRPTVDSLFGKYSIAAYLTNPLIIDNLYTPLKLEGVKSIEMMETTVDLLTHFAQTTGGKKSLNFNDSLRFVKRIAPTWDSLKMASSNQDPEENDFAVDDSSNHSPTPEEIAAVYAGNYSLVPSNYPLAKGLVYGLVANTPAFNSLSNDRKLQVSNYLLNNKQLFNSHLSNACITIANEIERCMDSKVKLAKGLLSDNISKQLNRCSNSLFSAYEPIRGSSTATKLNFIIRAFLPLTNAFSSRLSAEVGLSEAKSVSSKLASANLSIFANELHFNDSLSGGDSSLANSEVKFITEAVEKPVFVRAPLTEQEFLKIRGGEEPFNSGVRIEKAESVIRRMSEAQRKFNDDFTAAYRKLINDINNVEFGDIYKDRLNIYYAIPTILNSITINNAKSTIYISGLYGKHNYNAIYAEALAGAVDEMRKLNISQTSKITDDLSTLHNLVVNVGKKATELASLFSSARDATPELLMNGVRAIKVRSDLSSTDFNAMNEAIQRLLWKLNGTSSESDLRNHRDDLKRYLEKTKNREKMIEEHFIRKEQDLLFDVREIRPSAGYRNDYIQAKKAIYSQQLALFKYINNTFDIAFTKQKLADISEKTLTPAQIKKMENAFLLFKKSKTAGRFYDDYNKLVNELAKSSSMFTLAKYVKKLIAHSHYVEFIETLYRELGIFDKSFNWSEFKDNILNFLAINSFDVDFSYEFNFKPKSSTGDVNDLRDVVKPVVKLNDEGVMNSSYEKYLFLVLAHKENTAGIAELFDEFSKLLASMIRNKSVNSSFIDGDVIVVKLNKEKQLETKLNDDAITMKRLSFLLNNEFNKRDGKQQLFKLKVKSADEAEVDLESYTVGVGADAVKHLYEILKLSGDDAVKGVEAFPRLQSSRSHTSEDKLLEFVFDSLISNVVLVIDKYWKLKYHGSASIPINVEQALRGGAMPGSVFDVKTLHDYTNAEVIPEAVPFYVCALNCAQYYVNHAEYGKINADIVEQLNSVRGKRHVRASKISSIYPLVQLFSDEEDGYHAKVKDLTIQQLNTALSVLNLIWNRTTGSNTHRLSAAIDIFLSELNTCIYITDDAHEALLMSNFVVTDDVEHALFEKLDESLNLMRAAIKSAHMDTYTWSNPEVAQVKFESILKKAMESVKEKEPAARMSELRNVLHDTNKDADAEFSEYYRFMDGVFAPLVTTYRSYASLFKLFIYYRRIYKLHDNDNEVLKVDLDDYSYKSLDQTKKLWSDFIAKGADVVVGTAILAQSPAVQAWNNVLYFKMLNDYLKSGVMNAPVYWEITNIETYPKYRLNETIIPKELNYSHFINIEPLRQIWPMLRARTVGDYFEMMLKEYSNDVDEVLHLFMSYPGIGLETIRAIERECHDQITFRKLVERSEIREILDDLRNVEIKKSETLILPRWSEREIIIPEFVAPTGRAVPEVRFEMKALESGDKIDGTDLKLYRDSRLVSKTPLKPADHTAEANMKFNYSFYPSYGASIRNGLIDRTLFTLATCNPVDYTVPYKLAQLISTNPVLLRVAKPILLSSDSAITYDANLNPITQNIMGRSLSESNQNKEYFDFTPQTIAGLISVIPYLINCLQTANLAYSSGANYRGVSVLDEANSLINVLTQFYAEITPYAQPLGFLQKNTYNVTNDHDHPMGELVHYTAVDTTSIDNMIAMEWANKFAFSHLKNIAFPDFKNRDKFEWWKNFEEDKLRSPAFAKNSQIILENNGRLVWSAMIANTASESNRAELTSPKLDEIIKRINTAFIFYIAFGNDKLPLQRFINLFVNNHRDVGPMAGGSSTKMNALLKAALSVKSSFSHEYLDYLIGGGYSLQQLLNMKSGDVFAAMIEQLAKDVKDKDKLLEELKELKELKKKVLELALIVVEKDGADDSMKEFSEAAKELKDKFDAKGVKTAEDVYNDAATQPLINDYVDQYIKLELVSKLFDKATEMKIKDELKSKVTTKLETVITTDTTVTTELNSKLKYPNVDELVKAIDARAKLLKEAKPASVMEDDGKTIDEYKFSKQVLTDVKAMATSDDLYKAIDELYERARSGDIDSVKETIQAINNIIKDEKHFMKIFKRYSHADLLPLIHLTSTKTTISVEDGLVKEHLKELVEMIDSMSRDKKNELIKKIITDEAKRKDLVKEIYTALKEIVEIKDKSDSSKTVTIEDSDNLETIIKKLKNIVNLKVLSDESGEFKKVIGKALEKLKGTDDVIDIDKFIGQEEMMLIIGAASELPGITIEERNSDGSTSGSAPGSTTAPALEMVILKDKTYKDIADISEADKTVMIRYKLTNDKLTSAYSDKADGNPAERDISRVMNLISDKSMLNFTASIGNVNTSGFINQGKPFVMRGGLRREFFSNLSETQHIELLEKLINVNPTAFKPTDMLRELYGRTYYSFMIFRHLFGIDESWKLNDCKKIFAATINYFHKDSLDVTQLFERMIYASTILGAASLRLSAERIKKVIEEVRVGEENQVTSIITRYIEQFYNGDIAIRNFSLYDLNLNDVVINDSYLANTDAGKLDAMFKPSNIQAAPHANPNFVKSFLETANGKDHSTLVKIEAKDKPIARTIPFTVAGTAVLRMDYLCTYVDCLISLMHMTDYYDHESDTHLPFVAGLSEYNQFDVL